jgi:hypothetical protein
MDAAARGAVKIAQEKGNVVGARLGRELLQGLRDLPAAPRT